jgi:hypothetical protein
MIISPPAAAAGAEALKSIVRFLIGKIGPLDRSDARLPAPL